MTKALLIGIDAADRALLEPLCEAGLMPNTKAFLAGGGSSVLDSTIPWFTVPGWVSMMTGVPAGDHGLIAWTIAHPSALWEPMDEPDRFVSFSDITRPTVFELASEAGARVASINMPVTYPPRPLNGFMVSGFPGSTDLQRAVWPPDALAGIDGYRVDIQERPDLPGQPLAPDRIRALGQDLAAMTAARAQLATRALRDGFDLVSVVFVGLDRLLHLAWPAIERTLQGADDTSDDVRGVQTYLRALDDAVGDLVAAGRGDRIIVLASDHGSAPPPERTFSINGWLQDEGFLSVSGASLKRLSRFVPKSLRAAAWRRARARRHRPLHIPPFIDATRSEAYGIRFPHCELFGVAFDPARREQSLPRIVERLATLRDDAGEPLVRRTWTRGDLADAGAASFPDIVCRMPAGWATSPLERGPVVQIPDARTSGEHSRAGIMAAMGPGVEQGRFEASPVWAVAPALLSALGLDVPEHMAPERIDWLGIDLASARQPTRDPAAAGRSDRPSPEPVGVGAESAQERSSIEEHLRGLGYID